MLPNDVFYYKHLNVNIRNQLNTLRNTSNFSTFISIEYLTYQFIKNSSYNSFLLNTIVIYANHVFVSTKLLNQ